MLVTQFFAVAIRAEFKNSLGWVAGILRPSIAFDVAETMDRNAEFVLDGSATLAAVTATVAGEGIAEGAVYRPLLLMTPHAVPLQPDPFTVHVAPVLEVPVTEAENCCVAPVATEALVGLTVTTIAGTTATVADADLLGSAALVTITLTPDGEGATDGAAYTADSPFVESVPQAEPLQPGPLRLQATAVFDVPVTVAVNDCIPAAGTEALVGLMLTSRGTAATMVTLAEADFFGSATLVAVTLTVAWEGALDGDV